VQRGCLTVRAVVPDTSLGNGWEFQNDCPLKNGSFQNVERPVWYPVLFTVSTVVIGGLFLKKDGSDLPE
jgi:hypothetical protein